eukprot:3347744-Amphidinium_carterae.2
MQYLVRRSEEDTTKTTETQGTSATPLVSPPDAIGRVPFRKMLFKSTAHASPAKYTNVTMMLALTDIYFMESRNTRQWGE